MPVQSGSMINHITLVRIAVEGEGNLDIQCNSFRQVRTRTSAPIVLSDPMDKIGSTLTNFLSQRAQVEVSTNSFGEWFKFSTIIPFIKPSATSYPNG